MQGHASLASREVRHRIRAGEIRHQTSGLAPGFVQGNLAIFPREWADDFLRFCLLNSQPCPVIGMTLPGDPAVPALGEDIDLRTDLPGYHVWRDGKRVDAVHDIRDLWRDDLVGFVLGCSHSFEEALTEAGVPVRNIQTGKPVAVYQTTVPCTPTERFHGPMVVSMRPMTPAQAIRAVQVCTRFPQVHGAPVHLGDPGAIGIQDLARTDFVDPDQAETTVEQGELPVFWACGITPQAVIAASKVPFCITHAPGCMLVTDRRNSELAVL